MNPYDPIPCLDKGFVVLTDTMPAAVVTEGYAAGLDLRVAEAAWVDDDATEILVERGLLPPAYLDKHNRHDRTRDGVRRIIRYMMEHRHDSPFEMPQLTFRVRAPLFVRAQWFRHRMAHRNEESRRYHDGTSIPIECFDIPHPCGEPNEYAMAEYVAQLAQGERGELARAVLPQSMYTHWMETWDLRNLLHFLHLRCDSHAQEEIQVYAEAIRSIVKAIAPLTVEAWEDYVVEAERLSRLEAASLRGYIRWLERKAGMDGEPLPSPAPHPDMSSGEARRWAERYTRLMSHKEGPPAS